MQPAIRPAETCLITNSAMEQEQGMLIKNIAILLDALIVFCQLFSSIRCWVAGWGKDNSDGDFQFIQHKVDVPLYDRFRCETRIRAELSKTNPSIARTFSLHPGEL